MVIFFIKMSEGTKKCCVPGCASSSHDNLSLFRFPKDEPRCSRWKRLVGNPQNYEYSSTECYNRLRICSLHFRNECFAGMLKNRLKKDAVPSFNSDLIQEDENNTTVQSVVQDETVMKRKRNEQINFQDQIKEILVCKYCTFETENIDELDNHILNHEEKCEDVEEALEDEIMLVNDIVSTKKPKKEVPDSFKCPHCKYETKRKHDLPKHLLTHSSPDTTTIYKCSQCPYETKRKNDMPKHMLAHCTNVQMFKCPECPYQTKRKSDLPKHLLCHKLCGEVPLYKCDYCEYVTKRKGDLPKHVLNHEDGSNLKLFDCSECQYKTKRKNDLHKHMLVHCDRHVAGVFKCLKCTYATDKVNKFSKHALSGCKYCDDAINIEHLMLEDIIGTVDEENIGIDEEEAENYEGHLPYMEEQDEENEITEEQMQQACSQSLIENEYAQYKMNDEISKTNYREAVRKKHGIFKINLGEFSYENNSQNVNSAGFIKEENQDMEDISEDS